MVKHTWQICIIYIFSRIYRSLKFVQKSIVFVQYILTYWLHQTYVLCVQAHSSVEKAGLIGLVKMRYIESDENLSLRGDRLREAIARDREKGLVPFFVSHPSNHYSMFLKSGLQSWNILRFYLLIPCYLSSSKSVPSQRIIHSWFMAYIKKHKPSNFSKQHCDIMYDHL